ncbi:GIY-YIG nuclease family protein [Candidatus Thorarchaeota archaeon]|nr:MAG: GIY-YIG nuclease family protein [Candidatus Thorarchaeota archaeon]
MKGGYVLLIQVPNRITLNIKSLGTFSLDPGVWVYVGSAMGSVSTNLENRIRRHFGSQKKIHWHIDYLLASDSKLNAAIWAESNDSIECEVAQRLENNQGFEQGPRGFGASDCKKGCRTHIYRAINIEHFENIILDIFSELKLNPKITYSGKIVECT